MIQFCPLLFAICNLYKTQSNNYTNILKNTIFTAPKNIVCTQPFRCMLLPDTKGIKIKDIKELRMQAVGGWSLRKHSFLLFCCYSIKVRSRQDGGDFDVWETLWKSPQVCNQFLRFRVSTKNWDFSFPKFLQSQINVTVATQTKPKPSLHHKKNK